MSNPLGNVPLTLEQLLEHHKSICQEALDIMEKKNHDYCGGNGGDPFANFTRSEMMGICTAEQGFLVRICDKLSRLTTFVNQGTLKVENESVIICLDGNPFVNNKRLVQFDYADLSTDKKYDVELNEGVVALFTKV